jgi:hypothetical protein
VQQNKFVTVNENTVKQLNTGFPSAKQGQWAVTLFIQGPWCHHQSTALLQNPSSYSHQQKVPWHAHDRYHVTLQLSSSYGEHHAEHSVTTWLPYVQLKKGSWKTADLGRMKTSQLQQCSGCSRKPGDSAASVNRMTVLIPRGTSFNGIYSFT